MNGLSMVCNLKKIMYIQRISLEMETALLPSMRQGFHFPIYSQSSSSATGSAVAIGALADVAEGISDETDDSTAA